MNVSMYVCFLCEQWRSATSETVVHVTHTVKIKHSVVTYAWNPELYIIVLNKMYKSLSTQLHI